MKSNDLKTAAKIDRKRKGRGISAGQGKTAGRGTKGQNSRTGGSRRPGFEGGQTPLFMRIPKARGFTSRHKVATVTLTQLSRHKGADVTLASLIEQGIVDSASTKAKVVNTGEISTKFSLDSSVRATKTAEDAIKKAGGSVA